MRRALLLALALGCAPSSEERAASCGPGETAHGEVCVPRVDACDGAQRAKRGGGCAPVGVPSDGCGDGFTHDGAGGCVAVLPTARCADGQLALPGETACHPVGPCGEGTWGTIPVTAATLYVDAAYAGGASDGTRDRPFTTIQAAIDAARPDATIAIAAGTYREDLRIRRPLALWGRCAEKVTVEGISTAPAAVAIRVEAGSELHDLSVRGANGGISVLYATGPTLLDRVRVHDTGERGLRVEGNKSAPSPVLVRRSLFERNAAMAVHAYGGTVTVEDSVLRDGVYFAKISVAIAAEADAATTWPATLTVRRTLIERMKSIGIAVASSHAKLETTVVRDIDGSAGRRGVGVTVERKTAIPIRPTATLDRVVIERAAGMAFVAIGATATLTRVTLRETLPQLDGELGTGVQSESGGDVSVEDSSIVSFRDFGAFAWGAGITLRRALIADGLGTRSGASGLGVYAIPDSAGARSSATIAESLIARVRAAGMFVSGSDGNIEDSEVRDVQPQGSTKTFGDGVGVSADGDPSDDTFRPGVLAVHRTIIRRTARAAVNVAGGGQLTIGDTLLMCSGFDLEVDRNFGGSTASVQADFVLEDAGGNVCGCGAVVARCKAGQSGLSPMSPGSAR